MRNTTKQKRKRRVTPKINKKGTRVSGHINYATTGKMLSTIKRMMSANQQMIENE